MVPRRIGSLRWVMAGDADRRLWRSVAGDIAGEFGIGPFRQKRRRIEAKIAFDDDLGARRHVKIDRLAFYQFDRRAADGADDVVFAQVLRHRRAADEIERRLPADGDRDRHFVLAGLLPGSGVLPDMLRAPHQDRDHILARHHAAIDADIHDVGGGILGDDAAVGEDVAAAVGAVPLRRREIVEVDVVAFDDVLLHRSGGDDFRRDGVGEHGAAELDQFARMGVGRQAQHHGDAAVARQAAGEHAAATRVLAVVADSVESERRPGAGPLRQPRHGAELDIPVHLGVDRMQFAGGFERLHPAAQVAEGDWFPFRGHCLSRCVQVTVLLRIAAKSCQFTSPRLLFRYSGRMSEREAPVFPSPLRCECSEPRRATAPAHRPSSFEGRFAATDRFSAQKSPRIKVTFFG